MNRATRMLSLMAIMIVGFAAAAHAEDRKEIQSRIDKRLPVLEKARDAGTIGETTAGQIEFVKSDSDGKLKELVDEENKDRKALFVIIASESGGTIEDVTKTYAKKLFEIAKPEHYLKGKNGVWIQKKNVGK